ncbi:short chain dehydrogenase [Spongiibacter sp. IMCC21906]|uniref:SDR family NAD(P)-dependent oxidoreductase n=1 Tax=Spongiibacter sp. IMCC21906 TaxID=1620392 RepID=UPI00062E021B|nr:SDR family NAD(P)-dependent oxidoreductase [Spongiibacter sp. IMCC21906]AKH67789.1 short chain dehydrogenase [Spongiibacter sp. IMCC21906]
MSKTILITGSTDGIGLMTAELLLGLGHHVLLHGRNQSKLEQVRRKLLAVSGAEKIDTYSADLSNLAEVAALAASVLASHNKLDVVVNNAGVFKSANAKTAEGLDLRFVVNTIAPYLLTQRLLPLLNSSGRVINLSSAAQSPVEPKALKGEISLSDDFNAYAQSKLALTMWSRQLALSLRSGSVNDKSLATHAGPAIIAVNPGSMLGTKMVKEGFGVAGGDVRKGADILLRAALSDEFASATGLYFDNDSGDFSHPHADALDELKSQEIVELIEKILTRSGV